LFVELGVAVTVTVVVGEDDSVLDGLALVLSKGDIICFLISIYYNLEIITVEDEVDPDRVTKEVRLTRSSTCMRPLFVLRSSQSIHRK
jgi:hypothetical protein